jgi:NADPH:quinone reductase-like Zn-dependent oxidoreductase/acyl carrier protein
VQIIQRAGGVVFATAGTPEKREFLRSLGVPHVMDSRSLAFADEILEATRGEGIDIVLNSLGGEALPRSLGLLRRFGRFLEIGKRDLVQNSRLGLRPFEKCLSFHSVDIDQLLLADPALVRSLLDDLVGGFERGEFRPLPHRAYPIGRVAEAFRCMQHSRHIGKLVVSLGGPASVQDRAGQSVRFRGDGCYLITGGLGGVGLALARWMVANGARHLALVGRRGTETPEALQAVASLEAAGARVAVAQTDVSDPEQVGRLVAELGRSMPPLRGVFHAALVLDDGIVLQLDRNRFRKVMEPKVAGSWNLHRQTLGLPLDFFVLFSSFTSMLGNPGQGNYAAAGAFLDELAHYRRGKGLPALTVNWGALAGAGHVARNPEVASRLLRQGVRPIEIAEALDLLGRLLVRGRPQVGVMNVDWPKWNKNAAAAPPRLAQLLGSTAADPHRAEEAPNDFPGALLDAAPTERRWLVEARLCDHVARVLGTSASRLAADRPVTSLGLDSLMAVDLRIRLERDLGVDVPVKDLMRGPSIADLTGFVLERLGQSTTVPSTARPPDGSSRAERSSEPAPLPAEA